MTKFMNYKYDAYVFDLDDTLIPMNVYLFKVFEEISREFNIHKGLAIDFKDAWVNNRLTFFCEEYIRDSTPAIIDKCLHISNTINTKLPMLTEALDIASEAHKRGKPLYILTNGNKERQANKIRCMEKPGWFKPTVIFAQDYAPKPSPAGLIEIFNRVGSRNIILIGDSDTDSLCAQMAAIDFYRVNNQ